MSKANGTVVLFLGHSNFGNIGSMVLALADGFDQLRFDSVIIDIRRAGYEVQFLDIIRSRKIVGIISVSRFGLPPSPKSNAIRIFNKVNAPILAVFLDHPFCLYKSVALPLKNFYATFPAGHAATFCER